MSQNSTQVRTPRTPASKRARRKARAQANRNRPVPANGPAPLPRGGPNRAQGIVMNNVRHSVSEVHTTNVVRDLILQATMPADQKRLRLPYDATQKTAVADLEVDIDLKVSAPPVGLTSFWGTQTAMLVTGQAGCPFFITGRMPNGTKLTYTLKRITEDDRWELMGGEMLHHTGATIPIAADYGVLTYGAPPGNRIVYPTCHGPWTGSIHPARIASVFIPCYFDKTVIGFLCADAPTVPTNLKMQLRATRFSPNGQAVENLRATFTSANLVNAEYREENVTWTDESGTVQVFRPGFWQFSRGTLGSDNATNALNWCIQIHLENTLGGDMTLLTPVTAPTFETNDDPFENTRVTASAFLATNVTSVLNKEGTILGARLDYDTLERGIPAFASSEVREIAQKVHPSKRYYGPLEHGGYTFSPYESKNLQFRRYRFIGKQTDRPTFSSAVTDIVPILYVNEVPVSVMYFDDRDSSASSQLAVRAEVHLEFRTDSPLFDVQATSNIESDLLLAQQVMANLPYFYENPAHFKMIKDYMNRVWKRLRPFAPALIRAGGTALSGAFPEAGPIPGYAAGALARLIE